MAVRASVCKVCVRPFAQLNQTNPRPLVIQADKSVPTELLVSVMDQAKLAGVTNINIATARE